MIDILLILSVSITVSASSAILMPAGYLIIEYGWLVVT